MKWAPCKFLLQLMFASVCMATGWGALLWWVATPWIGVVMGVLIFVVSFSAFYFAESHAMNDLGEIYNRRFDD